MEETKQNAESKEQKEFFDEFFKEEPDGEAVRKAFLDAAEMFLRRHGCEILEREWSCKLGEVDLIVETDDDMLALVEVGNSVIAEDGFPGVATVDDAKRSKYERIAGMYLKDWFGGDIQVRFDIVEFMPVRGDAAFVRWHVNAWGCDQDPAVSI